MRGLLQETVSVTTTVTVGGTNNALLQLRRSFSRSLPSPAVQSFLRELHRRGMEESGYAIWSPFEFTLTMAGVTRFHVENDGKDLGEPNGGETPNCCDKDLSGKCMTVSINFFSIQA